MISRPHLCYVNPATDNPFPPSFYHSFLFFEVEKTQRYVPTHDTSTHVFKQLNQIVTFK